MIGLLIALAAIATQDAGAAVQAPPPAPPRQRGSPMGNPGMWFTDDDYPPAARKSGAQGAVNMRLSIDVKGRVAKCEIVEGSGYPELDSLSCTLAYQRAEFHPQIDAEGKPQPFIFMIKTRWIP